MNLTSLVSDTARKYRYLRRTESLLYPERLQRIRTADVQSNIFVREMLAACAAQARMTAGSRVPAGAF